jgi:hypothetical protein
MPEGVTVHAVRRERPSHGAAARLVERRLFGRGRRGRR